MNLHRLRGKDLRMSRHRLKLISLLNERSSTEWVKNLPIGKSLFEIEMHLILRTLREAAGNRSHAAKSLGISLRALRNRISLYEEYGIYAASPQGEVSKKDEKKNTKL